MYLDWPAIILGGRNNSRKTRKKEEMRRRFAIETEKRPIHKRGPFGNRRLNARKPGSKQKKRSPTREKETNG